MPDLQRLSRVTERLFRLRPTLWFAVTSQLEGAERRATVSFLAESRRNLWRLDCSVPSTDRLFGQTVRNEEADQPMSVRGICVDFGMSAPLPVRKYPRNAVPVEGVDLDVIQRPLGPHHGRATARHGAAV